MEETILELVDRYPVIIQVIGGLVAAHALALFVVTLTPTPKDDRFVGKVYRVVEYVAGVIGRAKEQPGEGSES